MKGSFNIEINSKKINYKFTINRKITILIGNSSSGKTKLTNLIDDKKFDKSIKIISNVDLINLPNNESYIQLLESYTNKIITIDEDHLLFNDKYFARRLKESDNYFVIINRDRIDSLPYSYKEIYELNYDKKTNTNYFKRLYKDYENEKIPIYNTSTVITEDSNSGYKMYDYIRNEYGFHLKSANGKSNIVNEILKNNNKDIIIIADGAAFGSNIITLSKLLNKYSNLKLYLPECFEYLLIKSFFKDFFNKFYLNKYTYIDSKLFFSWENYFEYKLKELCINELNINYNKESLNQYFKDRDKINTFITTINNDLIFIKYPNINEKLDWI